MSEGSLLGWMSPIEGRANKSMSRLRVIHLIRHDSPLIDGKNGTVAWADQ
jgi:hypothetical protein